MQYNDLKNVHAAGEIVDYKLDLILPWGGTLIAARADLSVFQSGSGSFDPASESSLVGIPSISGRTITQRVGPLVGGVTYSLVVAAQTSTGEIIEATTRICCVSSASIAPGFPNFGAPTTVSALDFSQPANSQYIPLVSA